MKVSDFGNTESCDIIVLLCGTTHSAGKRRCNWPNYFVKVLMESLIVVLHFYFIIAPIS